MANDYGFDTQFRDVINRYLLYLDAGGDRYKLLRQPYQPSVKRYVSAGNLLDCPLKSAKEKSGAEAVIPELLKSRNPTLLLRMLQGTTIAEIFQEAFCWYEEACPGIFYDVAIERTLESSQLSLRGRVDMRCMHRHSNSAYHIVEFKHRLPTYKDKFPQPRIADVYQLLAYIHMQGTGTKGHLCIINTPQYSEFLDAKKGYALWELVIAVNGDNVGWNLIDEEGNLWNHPLNTPEYINIMALEQEIERQMMYIEGVETPPIELHNDEAWQCRKVITKPTDGKSGRFRPMCAYYCHDEGTASPEYGYSVNDDGTWSVVW